MSDFIRGIVVTLALGAAVGIAATLAHRFCFRSDPWDTFGGYIPFALLAFIVPMICFVAGYVAKPDR